MQVAWVLATQFIPPTTYDVNRIKNIAPIWGSYRTLELCGTDNAVCHDRKSVAALVRNQVNQRCNLYVPKHLKDDFPGTRLFYYDGSLDLELDQVEDVVCMYLTANTHDIVLMLGFDLEHTDTPAQYIIYNLLHNTPKTQFVAIDTKIIDPKWIGLSNFTCDNLETVLQSLS